MASLDHAETELFQFTLNALFLVSDPRVQQGIQEWFVVDNLSDFEANVLGDLMLCLVLHHGIHAMLLIDLLDLDIMQLFL